METQESRTEMRECDYVEILPHLPLMELDGKTEITDCNNEETLPLTESETWGRGNAEQNVKIILSERNPNKFKRRTP